MTAPAPEKAAPIPAEVADRSIALAAKWLGKGHGATPYLGNDIARAIMQDRADRQEERIREDEPLPERLRKSYEKGAQDERDRLYKAGLKWPRDVCDFLEIEGAKVRARQRGDAS